MRRVLYKVFSGLGESKVRQIQADSHQPRQAQLAKLFQILRQNSTSRFGCEHKFEAISNWNEFDARVPVRDYEGFRPYIDRLAQGEKKVLTGEEPRMFATTSGTTDKPKFIPITPTYIKEFRNASVVSGYYLLKNFPGIAEGVVLSMTSPAEDGRTASGIPYGSISGLLFKNEPWLIKKFISPVPYDAYLIDDYESKYYAILRAALQLPVALFYTLNPSTIQLLCRRLRTHAQTLIKDVHDGTISTPALLGKNALERFRQITHADPARARYLEGLLQREQFVPHQIWPTLSVVSCWTKAAASFYLPDLHAYFGDVPICDITYGASEGRGTVFLSPDKQMLALHSHFFEFIPEEEINQEKPPVLLADQLEQGKNYFILFTTSGGLYRYNINDVVKVTGFHNSTPLIEFQYKGGNVFSFTGEKITELQVVEAMKRVVAENRLKLRFFTLVPVYPTNEASASSDPFYELWLECDGPSIHGNSDVPRMEGSVHELCRAFDDQLRSGNSEYELKRKSLRLQPVRGRLLNAGAYERIRRSLIEQGIPDAQIKISHLNPKQEVRVLLADELMSCSAELMT